MVSEVLTITRTSIMEIAMDRITERYRFGVLLRSFRARNISELPLVFAIRFPFFFRKRSPVCPFRMASTGDIFFTFFVPRHANAEITNTTRSAPMIWASTSESFPSTIFLLTESIRTFPKGKLKAPPISVPTMASVKYLEAYMLRIFATRIPTAFITPIS